MKNKNEMLSENIRLSLGMFEYSTEQLKRIEEILNE